MEGLPVNIRDYIASISEENKKECPIKDCKYIGFKTNLLFHVYTHFGVKKSLMCTFPGCFYEADKPIRLKRHSYIHEDGYRYKCDHEGCDHGFKSIGALCNHKNSHKPETERKPFVCQVEGCNLRFSKKTYLNEHSKKHKVNTQEKVSSEDAVLFSDVLGEIWDSVDS